MNALNSKLTILIVEDDPLAVNLLKLALKHYARILVCHNEKDLPKLESKLSTVDMALVDLDLEGKLQGFSIAKDLKERGIYTVIITGHDSKKNIKKGHEFSKVDDFITKPYDKKILIDIVEKYIKNKDSFSLTQEIKNKLITRSPKMDQVIESIKCVYSSSLPVYLFGATGTGKQVIAEIIHQYRFNAKENFHQFNCASIPDTMIESELFGHEKGSFTGADNTKIGLFEKANGGTIFLDEVATMSKTMQNKIITAIEQKSFRRLGSTKVTHSNFRLIAATSSDLTEEVNKGHFRSDLFFRLNGTNINIPSLTERTSDLEHLIDHFISEFSNGRVIYISKNVLKVLTQYMWPGNIRELRNLVSEWVDKNISKLEIAHLPDYIIKNEDIFNKNRMTYLTKKNINQINELGLANFLKEVRTEAIEYYLKEHKNKIRPTCSALKMHHDAIYTHIKATQGIQPELLH